MRKCHSIIVTGKVQDIGFRSVVEHIGRSFGMPGLVFNAKDGSVKILCCGEDSVIDNFTQAIKVRGAKTGVEITDIKEKTLSINIDLPDEFSKASSDDEIDIGRKLDKANLLLKGGFDNLNKDLNTGFNNVNAGLTDIKIGLNNLTDIFGSFIAEQRMYNKGQQEHNTRLEAILEKLANK
ncbi:MAG: acylphosphatase [Euryarchaeota archaeon]|nr:acylphosphatase [Euryarchaeota archaeon]MCG2737579.1 acylphosphatase [Candidatus Methanoperedenaceae archaeon]